MNEIRRPDVSSCPRLEDWVYGFAEEPAAHLAACARCREAADRLTRERELLAQAVGALAASDAVPRPARLPWMPVAAGILLSLGVIAVLLHDRPHGAWMPLGVPHPVADQALLRTAALQSSWRVRFGSRLEAQGSDPIEVRGEALWTAPSTLFVHDGRRKAIRIDSKLWIYHEALESWVRGEEMAIRSLGLPDVEQTLRVVAPRASRHARRFGLHREDLVRLLPDAAIPPDASATVELEEQAGRLKSVVISAGGRSWRYQATLEFSGYNEDRSFDFGVPLSEEIRRELENAK